MEKNYWLHRISHWDDVSYPLLEKGILSIAFSDFANTGFIEKCDNNWEVFEKSFLDNKWGKHRGRHLLWRFLYEMKKGDYVVVPTYKAFSVFEIVDNKAMLSNELDLTNIKARGDVSFVRESARLKLDRKEHKDVDLGFFRKVKPIIEGASRSDFADRALTARMKMQQTNAAISDLAKSIEEAIKGYKDDKPINLYEDILKKSLKDFLNLIRDKLNPDKLENLVRLYFKGVGASDVYKPPKKEKDKEGDADIIATFEHLKIIIYVQAKFHNKDTKTSETAVKQINDYINYIKQEQEKIKEDGGYSHLAWVISTADEFFPKCEELAKEKGVQLINGEEFTKMLLESGLSCLK